MSIELGSHTFCMQKQLQNWDMTICPHGILEILEIHQCGHSGNLDTLEIYQKWWSWNLGHIGCRVVLVSWKPAKIRFGSDSASLELQILDIEHIRCPGSMGIFATCTFGVLGAWKCTESPDIWSPEIWESLTVPHLDFPGSWDLGNCWQFLANICDCWSKFCKYWRLFDS